MSTKENKNEPPFYSYSIELTSFLDLHVDPFKHSLLDKTSFNDMPISKIGVLGKSQSGKTSLINELSRKFYSRDQLPPPNLNFNLNSSNAIYFKSVTLSSDSSILFMKAPSLDKHPLKRIRDYPFHRLLNDRDIMTKFIIGFFSWLSDLLIIVVDSQSEPDYEKHFNEIQEMRQNELLIVHNLSLETEESKAALMAKLNNSALYDKNTFISMVTPNPSDNGSCAHFYLLKANASIIHLIYEPKTTDELNNDDNEKVKENNTIMVNFLLSKIQTILQKKKGRSIQNSFGEYLNAFARQLYEDSPLQCITSTEEGDWLIEKYESKHLSASLVSINVMDTYSLKYEIDFEQIDNKKTLVIGFDLPSSTKMKLFSIKIIGTDFVLKYQFAIQKGMKDQMEKDKEKEFNNGFNSVFEFNNVITEPFDYEIRIPTSDCVIMTGEKVEKRIENRRVKLVYKILQEEAEEEQINLV